MKWLLLAAVLVGGCAGDTRMSPDDGRVSVCEYSAQIEAAGLAGWDCVMQIDCECGTVCVDWTDPVSGAGIYTDCGCDGRPLPLAEQPPVGTGPEDCNP